MAQYCPLPGQYLAVVRQDSLCREGVLKISATASFSCVSIATLAFTLHSSRFWCKLLIFNEYCGWRVGADSSPLFTTLHPDFFWGRNHFRNNVWSSMMTSSSLQWWLSFVIRWREVKSGEEWSLTLHVLNVLITKNLALKCEEWRVKAKVALYIAVFRFRACFRSRGLRRRRSQEWCICARSVPHRWMHTRW